MLWSSSTWLPAGLLILSASVAHGGDNKGHRPVIDTKTHYVDVTVPHYVTVKSTKTKVVTTCITESITTTLYFTVSITKTKTDSATITNTRTDSATVTNTRTDSATVTNTQTTTATVPATVTTYTTQTLISTTYDPCPTTCTISAGTVTVFFWPTDRPYTYPSIYVNTALDYTFTSPSVYMLIDTARGTNTAGQPAGPSTASWMLALDLEEVSTIVSGSITRQLTLSDLGTDCPQTAEPSAIATMVDSRCNPILAAPKPVSSWAYPCNACGRFGLFDPPYAVPTRPGGLIATTVPASTRTMPVPTQTATAAPVPGSPRPTSVPTTTQRSSPTSVVTASATRVNGGLAWFISSILIAVFLM